MFFCMLFAGFYFSKFNSVNNLQKIALNEIAGTDPTTIYYDQQCTTLAVKAMKIFLVESRRDAAIGALIISKKWSDPE